MTMTGTHLLLSRRAFLHASTAAVVLGLRCRPSLKLAISADAGYDDVLAALQTTDIDYPGGANHAPMAIEALHALGASEARIVEWTKHYSEKLELAETGAAIPPDDRAAAIGKLDKHAGLIAGYEEQLATTDYKTLIARELPRLLSGTAAGWHGIIRLAHGVYALEENRSDVRLREVAIGLGGFAAWSQPLPGVPGARAVSGYDVLTALEATPLVPAAQRVGGNIYGRMAALKGRSDFTDAVETVDLAALPVTDAVNGLVSLAARIFVNEGKANIALIHAVTGTAALRPLLPLLSEADQRAAVGHAYQAVAAAYASQGTAGGTAAIAGPSRSADAIYAESIAAEEEHVFKVAITARREAEYQDPSDVLTALESWAKAV